MFDLVLRSKAAAYLAWMPFIRGGGLFIPTRRLMELGDEVLVSLTLLERPRVLLRGTVVWINPASAPSGRPQGIGIRLTGDDSGREAKETIEAILAGTSRSSRATNTL